MTRNRKAVFALGILVAVFPVLAPAASAGFFDQLFGGLRRVIEAPTRLPEVLGRLPEGDMSGPGPTELPVENGPTRGFCVRTCDGSYFPVQTQSGVSAAETCQAQCPATAVKLYKGGNIDSAVADDGSSYATLPNAFLYRKQMTQACTCNGRTTFGMAQVDVKSDPTLRPGDIVMTQSGPEVFTGARGAEFKPVEGNRRGILPTTR